MRPGMVKQAEDLYFHCRKTLPLLVHAVLNEKSFNSVFKVDDLESETVLVIRIIDIHTWFLKR